MGIILQKYNNYNIHYIYRMNIIIVRYKEDISWIKSLSKDDHIHIYNKGPKITNDFTDFKDCSIFNVENIGRESEGYLRFIIKNYDKIKDDEQYVFTQADPFDHCHNFIQKINNLKKRNYNCTLLGDNIIVNISIQNENYENMLLLKHYYLNNQLVVKTYQGQNYVKCNFIRDNNLKYQWSTDNVFIHLSQARQNAFKKIFNKPIPTYNWTHGAIFAIKGKHIKCKPKEHYIKIKNELLGCKSEDLGYLYEKIWTLFFLY